MEEDWSFLASIGFYPGANLGRDVNPLSAP